MKEIIRKISAGLGIASLLAFNVLGFATGISAPVDAAQPATQEKICEGVNAGLPGANCGNGTINPDDLFGYAGNIINWVLIIVGIIAVLFIIIGGIRYATSAGDPDKVKKAKNTLLYAIIGLAVALLAAVIVNAVIGIANNVQG